MSSLQQEYFEQAYRTGSDIWSHVPYYQHVLSLLPALPKESFVLDIGSGRGIWIHKLVALGYKVLGLDYVQHIVDQVNRDIHFEGCDSQARAVCGDVRDIPFADNSFQLVTDIATFQHLDPTDWEQYRREIARVLAPQGWFVCVTLSKETTKYLGWNPKLSDQKQFEKFNVSYYFFEQQEVVDIFAPNFVVHNQFVRYFSSKSDPHDSVALLFTLFQKK